MSENPHADRELSDPSQGSSYRWVILAVAFLVHATTIALIWQAIPPLKKEIAPALGTGWETAAIIYSAFSLGMMFTQLPGGALGDKYPLKYVVGLGGILAGVATMIRFAVPSLWGQVALSIVATIGMGLVNPNLIKVVTDWFPAHQLGLGQGILLSGNTLASGLALSLSAGVVLSALGSWQTVFILYGGLTVLTGILWLVLVRGPRDEERPIDPDTGDPFETGDSVPLRESIMAVLRAPSTKWAIATAAVAFWAILGSLSVLPEFADAQSYAVPEAVLGVPLYLGTFGAILLPLFSDRYGRAISLNMGVVGLAVGITITGFAPSLPVFALGMVISGFFGGGLNAMFYLLPGSLTDIEPAHVGTMSGVILSLSNIGAVASTAASAQVLSTYGIRVGALFVALPPLLGLYFITKLRLSGTGAASTTVDDDASPAEGTPIADGSTERVTSAGSPSNATPGTPDGASARTPVTGSSAIDYGDIVTGEHIGSGGHADVYHATASTPDGERTIALKEPRFEGTLHADTVQRFVDEAAAWDRLDDHDNVVDVLGWGAEPRPWLAMEYADGGTLSTRLEEGNFDVAEALWVGAWVADAVHHAHRNGVVHYDLKPANVLFRSVDDGPDVPTVGDWGLSKLLLGHSESYEGFSPQYAAPEQFATDEYGRPDDRTDIYQLGTVCYELLTGEPAFAGDYAEATRATLHETPPAPTSVRPELPSGVDEVLGRALAKDQADRYQSAREFRDELRALSEEL